MDKFFIQNAFKTLDEIEAEMKEKGKLTESIESRQVNEDLDLDELSDKYVGLGCTINDPENQYVDEHGSIKSLVDFNGDFENSVWKIMLDIGISLNVEGKNLVVELEEKLPRDLARAYANSADKFRATKDSTGNLKDQPSQYLPKKMGRRNVRIDFEKANYTEISKEEALKNYKKEGERSKLRVLFRPDSKRPLLMMWDEDNTPLIKPQDLEYYVTGSVWSFKNIINSADKIYVTDEADHKISREKSASAASDSETIEGKARKVDVMLPYWDRTNADKLAKKAVSTILNPEGETDTGRHKSGSYEDTRLGRLKDTLISNQKKYDKLAKAYAANPADEDTKYMVERALEYLKSAQIDYNQERADRRYPNKSAINRSLAELIVLKYLLKKERDKFEQTDSGNSSNSDLKYHQYKRLTDKLADLEVRLKDITQAIAETKAAMTPELKKDYEEKYEQELLQIGDEYYKLLDQLNNLRKSRGLPTEGSLQEDLMKEEKHLRIYTVNETGYEDFVDDDWESEEQALENAKELAKDDEYTRVCLVKITYYPDINDEEVEILFDTEDETSEEDLEEEITDKRSIGEIVDDKLRNEALTESKKFNLKDEDDLINAVTYKTVGEQSEKKLIVIDPSIESEDEANQPHVGDAVLQCKECKTTIFKDPNELEKVGDTNIYNKDMPCPHCGAKSGFLYFYQIAEKPGEEKEEVVDTEDIEEVKVDEDDNVDLEPVEQDFVDLDDIKEVKEESFEKLVNPYLTKLYENVKEFKTTEIIQPGRNTIKVKGNLIGNNGKEKLVEFLFTIKENNAHSIVFEGYNNLLTEDLKAYNLKGIIKDNALVFESFKYKYNKNVDGEQVLIEGIEK